MLLMDQVMKFNSIGGFIKRFLSTDERLNFSGYVLKDVKYFIIGLLVLGIILSIGIIVESVCKNEILFCCIMFPLAIPAVLIIFAKKITLDIRRVKDMGLSNWWIIALNIPIIQYFFMIIPGTQGENRFGMQPAKPSLGIKIFTSFLWLIALFVSILPKK